MKTGLDDPSSFSCQSLFPTGIGNHGPKGSRPGSGLGGSERIPPNSPLVEEMAIRKPNTFRPIRPSISSHLSEDGTETFSPPQNTTRGDLEGNFKGSLSDLKRTGGSGPLGTTSREIVTTSGADRSSSCTPVEAIRKATTVYDLTVSVSTETASGNGDIVTGSSEKDLTDSGDGAVMAMLAEFTEMARLTAVQHEELQMELSEEKRRVAHTNRKLDQCKSTCDELRESLALAQDTVVRLREREMKWAESTSSEMSLRAEMCALKDERATALGDAVALKKRCEALQRENNELGERFAVVVDEKRQVESRARRLLRSDRYRGF